MTVDAASARVAIDGRRVAVLDLAGDPERPPLVLLHEGLGSIELWRELPHDLSRATGRRVVTFSRFGHGRSDRPAEPRAAGFFDDEALRVLPALRDQLDVSNPVLVGHSDGASIGLIHAAHHPVAGLVLIAPHVFVEPGCVEAIRGTRREYLDAGLRDRMARYHDDVDAAFWGWCDVWLDPAFSDWTLDAEAAAVSVPTLLIQGAEDPYGTLAQLERIEAAVPTAKRFVVPGGHSPHLEHRAKVVAAIAAFVASL